MGTPKPGAAIAMAGLPGGLTQAKVEALFGAILKRAYMRPSMLQLWDDPRWVDERRMGVLSGTHMPRIDVHWTLPRDGGVDLGMMLSYYIDPMNREKLKVNACDILTVWVYDVQLLGDNAGKFGVPMEVFKRIVNIVQPVFAAVDDYSKNVKKRKGEDLRKFAWGATVYGPGMVETIGLDKLRSTPAWRVEELPWDGVWVQAGENPFNVDFRAKQAIEKHLGLKELFGTAQEVKARKLP